MTEMPGSMAWTTWIVAAAIAVSVAAAVWTAVNRRRPRPDLPPQHAAAAALIGFLAWDGIAQVPGLIGAITATAGMDNMGGFLLAQQVQLIVGISLVIGIVVAIVGMLRRRAWGAVLGIGLAASHVIGSVVAVISVAILQSRAVVVGDSGYFEFIAPTLLLGAVPSLVAIGLLAWPMLRTSPGSIPPRSESAATDWQNRTTPADPAS